MSSISIPPPFSLRLSGTCASHLRGLHMVLSLFLFCSETGNHCVTLTGLELSMETKLALNLPLSLYLSVLRLQCALPQ